MEVVKKYSEPELVLLLKERREAAFSYLYDNYASALYTIVLNVVADEEMANDVLQEVFVKIWRQIHSYDSSKGRLFTWMLNIARNGSIDMVRSKGFQQSKQNKELTDNAIAGAGTTQLKPEQIGLRKLLYQLKEEHRELVDLSYFQGYTQEEISQMLNIPLGTIKTRLRAALQQLRKIMTD